MRVDLPPAREFGWTLKATSSAQVTREKLADGRLAIAIDHDVVRGITTDMLGWWFQTFDHDVSWDGRSLQAYLLWHPYDHVRVQIKRGPSGRVSPGDRLHITEVFGRDERFVVDQVAEIERWDAHGVGFVVRRFGLRVFTLNHQFEDVPGGVRYRSRALVGVSGARLFNPLVDRMFPKEMAVAWVKHNVEEVGCFENFLAQLHATRNAGRASDRVAEST